MEPAKEVTERTGKETAGQDDPILDTVPEESTVEFPETWGKVTVDPDDPVTDFHEQIPDMVRQYPYELDNFQKQAILRVHNGKSVLVAAHTSSGKTAVAEYAIALALRNRRRAIYLSPIKALSNQKYRDFRELFGKDEIGMVTGDTSRRRHAPCVIMTAEILCRRLHEHDDPTSCARNFFDDIEWVIFDETHYINDLERGLVWELIIILLPPHVRLLLLSATIPNADGLADWIGRIKKREVFVIKTLKRPVPLHHHLYIGVPAVATVAPIRATEPVEPAEQRPRLTSLPVYTRPLEEGLFVVKVGDNPFDPDCYKKVVKAKRALRSEMKQHLSLEPDELWLALVEMLRRTDRLPAIGFVFNKQRIENYTRILSILDLTTEAEKKEIDEFMSRKLSHLTDDEKRIPVVQLSMSVIRKGIGFHHGGLTPILREVVELVFEKGLIKFILATDSFSVGINMPARTVAFDYLEKYNGQRTVDLTCAEYTQMAGRAGRRSIDPIGTVILLCKYNDYLIDMSTLDTILEHSTVKVESRFRLKYSLMLFAIKAHNLNKKKMLGQCLMEYEPVKWLPKNNMTMSESSTKMNSFGQQLLGQSFMEYEQMKRLTQCKINIKILRQHSEALTLEGCPHCQDSMETFVKLCSMLDDTMKKLEEVYAQHPQCPSELLGKLVVLQAIVAGHQRRTLALPLGIVDTWDEEKICCTCLALSDGLITGHEWAAGSRSFGTFDDMNQQQALSFIDAFRNPSPRVHDLTYLISNALENKRDPNHASPQVRWFVKDLFFENITYISKIFQPSEMKPVLQHFNHFSRSTGATVTCTFVRKNWELRTTPVAAHKLQAVLTSIAASPSSSENNDITGELPKADIGVSDPNVVTCSREIQDLKNQLIVSPCLSCPSFADHLKLFRQRLELQRQKESYETQLASFKLRLLPEYEKHHKLLQTLSYIDASDKLLKKGKIACYFGDNELFLTELILKESFKTLSREKMAAGLSCVATNKKAKPDITPVELQSTIELVQRVAESLDKAEDSCGFGFGRERRLFKLGRGFATAMYNWTIGKPFHEVAKFVDGELGSFINCAQSVARIMKEIQKVAANVLADEDLFRKAGEVAAAIRRPPVQWTSLYDSD